MIVSLSVQIPVIVIYSNEEQYSKQLSLLRYHASNERYIVDQSFLRNDDGSNIVLKVLDNTVKPLLRTFHSLETCFIYSFHRLLFWMFLCVVMNYILQNHVFDFG